METLSKRFYYRIEDKINGDTVEFYIGQSAGTQLGNDLMNASSEVIIVSPYINEDTNDYLNCHKLDWLGKKVYREYYY